MHKRTKTTFKVGHTVSKETREKIRLGNLNKKVSKTTRILMSKAKLGDKNPAKRPEVRRKLRIIRIKQIELCIFNGLPLAPCIGKKETKILNDLENKYKKKIIRQYFVNGYFLDGYIPELNIAFEVDEKHHFRKGVLSKYDIRRQQEIESELNCKFIRVKV